MHGQLELCISKWARQLNDTVSQIRELCVCVWLLKGSYHKEYINLITCKHEKNRPERIVLAASEHTQPQKYALRNKQLERDDEEEE